MKTGFYNIKKLDNPTLKEFYKDAVLLSYYSTIQTVIGLHRTSTKDKTLGEMIDSANVNNHNFCIDRSIQHDLSLYGEITYRIIGEENDYILCCYLSLDNLQKLVTKYNLIME